LGRDQNSGSRNIRREVTTSEKKLEKEKDITEDRLGNGEKRRSRGVTAATSRALMVAEERSLMEFDSCYRSFRFLLREK
jgi:ribosome recycling factor